MQTLEARAADERLPLPVLVLADLQDHMLSATTDLTRLEALLDDACCTLMARFHRATEQVRGLPGVDGAARDGALQQIAGAVTALQFQDMASQLIAHTRHRLAYCSDQLANAAFSGDEDGDTVMHAAPTRPNPVSQGGMGAGSIDLF